MKEVGVQCLPDRRLEILGDGATLLDEKNRFLLSKLSLGWVGENVEEIVEEVPVGLQVLDNIDLVEEDERVQHRKRRVIQNPGQDHILEVLQAICLVDLAVYLFVLDLDDLLEPPLVAQPLAMVRLVCREVRVVFQSAHHAQYAVIRHGVLDDVSVVQEDDDLHDVA